MARYPKRSDKDFIFFRVYRKRKNDARRRKIKWNLPFKYFLYLSKKNCFFCDAEPNNEISKSIGVARSKKHIKFQGIDRIDSKLGYSKNNVLPCCWVCNKIKSNKNAREFLCHVQKMLPRLTTLVIRNAEGKSGQKNMEAALELEEEITRLSSAK